MTYEQARMKEPNKTVLDQCAGAVLRTPRLAQTCNRSSLALPLETMHQTPTGNNSLWQPPMTT